MPMLAEPRRRERWTLNPRGNNWANDDNKFGQKMLEKMGWSKGKGLGREEQGMKEHVSVRFKDNSKGIGYKGSAEGNMHYEDFENVLAILNSHENSNANSISNSSSTSAANSDEETVNQKTTNKNSLESFSKASRARVHYHKFTRAKDLSRYSKDDLCCVLGSKQLKVKKGPEVEMETKTGQSSEVDEIGHVEHFNGVTTIKSCSVQDYFAQKMEAMRKYGKTEPHSTQEDEHGCDSEEENSVSRLGIGFNPGSGENRVDLICAGEENTERKKKKKRSCIKSKENAEVKEMEEAVSSVDCGRTERNSDEVGRKRVSKKKKKRKKTLEVEHCCDSEEENDVSRLGIGFSPGSGENRVDLMCAGEENTERKKKKKRSCKKSKENVELKEIEEAVSSVDCGRTERNSDGVGRERVTKEKKKRKKQKTIEMSEVSSTCSDNNQLAGCISSECTVKVKKKKKYMNNNEEEQANISAVEEQLEKKKKSEQANISAVEEEPEKKKKKKKNLSSTEEQLPSYPFFEENVEKKYNSNTTEEQLLSDPVVEESLGKKRKKKDSNTTGREWLQSDPVVEENLRKKKKKNNSDTRSTELEQLPSDPVVEENIVKKKKKKNLNSTEREQLPNDTVVEENVDNKKKNNLNRIEEKQLPNDPAEEDLKRESKNLNISEEQLPSDLAEANLGKKKRKRNLNSIEEQLPSFLDMVDCPRNEKKEKKHFDTTCEKDTFINKEVEETPKTKKKKRKSLPEENGYQRAEENAEPAEKRRKKRERSRDCSIVEETENRGKKNNLEQGVEQEYQAQSAVMPESGKEDNEEEKEEIKKSKGSSIIVTENETHKTNDPSEGVPKELELDLRNEDWFEKNVIKFSESSIFPEAPESLEVRRKRGTTNNSQEIIRNIVSIENTKRSRLTRNVHSQIVVTDVGENNNENNFPSESSENRNFTNSESATQESWEGVGESERNYSYGDQNEYQHLNECMRPDKEKGFYHRRDSNENNFAPYNAVKKMSFKKRGFHHNREVPSGEQGRHMQAGIEPFKTGQRGNKAHHRFKKNKVDKSKVPQKAVVASAKAFAGANLWKCEGYPT